MKLIHNAVLCTIISLSLFAISCSDPSDWYPQGTATIESVREIAAPEKNCVCTISITNTGKSKIWRSTVSIAVKTDGGEYFATAVSDTGILSGGRVYTTISIPYLSDTETILADGSRVVDAFFE